LKCSRPKLKKSIYSEGDFRHRLDDEIEIIVLNAIKSIQDNQALLDNYESNIEEFLSHFAEESESQQEIFRIYMKYSR